MKKRGFFFSTDALLALFLVVLGIYLVSTMYINDTPGDNVSFASEDAMSVLSSTKVKDLNNSYVNKLANNGTIDNNSNIVEGIGALWAKGKTDMARKLAKNVTASLVPEGHGVSFVINDDVLYTNNLTKGEELASYKSLVTGYGEDKPLNGTSARVYLSSIGEHKREAFTYFGGYIGQGNVTHSIELPTDFSGENFIDASIKAEIPGDFHLFINNISCGGLYDGSEGEVQEWDLDSCSSSFQPGGNRVKFVFDSELNQSYISGGFINVQFYTDTIKDSDTNITRYNFPEIEGLINIYDSLSAQGLITNININVTFYNEYDTFLTIGNETIFYAPGKNKTQNIQLDKDVMYPPTQVPLRMGVTNLSNVTVVKDGKPSDSVLVTDVSGSMDTCGIESEEEVTYCSYEYQYWYWWLYTECEYPGSCNANECNESTTDTRNHDVYTTNETVCKATFLEIAKNASNGFVDYVLDDSLEHRIGLVDYSDNADSYMDLTNAREVLHNEIDDYEADGNTCTCCAINRGRMLVEDSDNHRFIVLLSDGEPNLGCADTDTTDGSTAYDAEQTAYDAADRVCNENITLFTVGFGDQMSDEGREIMKNLACNESDYYNATDVEDLSRIYEQISQEILLQANYSAQTLDVVGNYTTTEIYEDSYVEMEYIPYSEEKDYGTVPMDFVVSDFGDSPDNCDAQVFIPENIDVEDAYVASFSGNLWNKKLSVNDEYVYNLDKYNANYSTLGDPFQLQVPAKKLEEGQINNFSLNVGDEVNNTNCSKNNSFIYTGKVDILNASAPYSEVLPKADGCTWHVENYKRETTNLTVPSDYGGGNHCYYTNSSHGSAYYNQNDSYDVATYNLLAHLDSNNNGRVFIDLKEDDLSINVKTIEHIPYLWGPAVAEVRIWK